MAKTKHFRLTARDDEELSHVCAFFKCKPSEAIRRLIRGHRVMLHPSQRTIAQPAIQQARVSGLWASTPAQSSERIQP